MTPKPNIQGEPQSYLNPPQLTETNDNIVDDEWDPAELVRLYEEVERFERLTARFGPDRRAEDFDLEEGSFNMSTIFGIMLVIIVGVTIYGLTHLFVATFKNFRFE